MVNVPEGEKAHAAVLLLRLIAHFWHPLDFYLSPHVYYYILDVCVLSGYRRGKEGRRTDGRMDGWNEGNVMVGAAGVLFTVKVMNFDPYLKWCACMYSHINLHSVCRSVLQRTGVEREINLWKYPTSLTRRETFLGSVYCQFRLPFSDLSAFYGGKAILECMPWSQTFLAKICLPSDFRFNNTLTHSLTTHHIVL